MRLTGLSQEYFKQGGDFIFGRPQPGIGSKHRWREVREVTARYGRVIERSEKSGGVDGIIGAYGQSSSKAAQVLVHIIVSKAQ